MTESNTQPSYPENTMEKLISLCKRKGFIYQGSEVYGGLAGTWDYGPLGVALKNNIKNMWWKQFVLDREDMYGVDAAILMNQEVWKASGHVGGFSDPLVECLECKSRFRVDHLHDGSLYSTWMDKFLEIINLFIKNEKNKVDNQSHKIESYLELKKYYTSQGKEVVLPAGARDELNKMEIEIKSHSDDLKESLGTAENMVKLYEDSTKGHGLFTQAFLQNEIDCPVCRKRNWSVPTQFNMMLKTSVGAKEDSSSISYLRPETAQGMFVNFKNIVDSFHPRLPFGLAQIGKAFRNEIAPRDFIFRTREFEQMEIEYFVKPTEKLGEGDKSWETIFDEFRKEVHTFTTNIGLSPEKVHELEVAAEDRAHYSKRTIDFEFDYSFGRKELYGLAYRTDFDLSAHMNASKADLRYFDEFSTETDSEQKRYIAHCIEPSFGVDRTVLAVLSDAYREDNLGDEPRAYLKLSPKVAPILVAVSPLLKNKEHLVTKAREVYSTLRKAFPGRVVSDDNGNIGKRYRRQDEIGTPFCVVIDFDTVEATDEKKDTVTIRHRDTGEQERIKIEELVTKISTSL